MIAAAAKSPGRRGYTLIELLVATASASVLMVGLSGALFVSSRALDVGDGAVAIRGQADDALTKMVHDVEEATRFLVLEPNRARFTVPDRDGDGQEETMLYRWSGVAGDPLQRQINGGPLVDFLSDVRSLQLTGITRSVAALDVTIPPPPPWPIVESSSSVKVESDANALTLPAPAGVQPGELLIASVVVHDINIATFVPPTGWAALDINDDANHVSYGVWWKIAGASEPASYLWRWTGDDLAIGVGLRISNQYAGNPITAFVGDDGKAYDADCPATIATLDNSLVLRFVGVHKDAVGTVGQTGLVGHTDVYMDETKEVSSGVGYQVQVAAGGTGTASFTPDANKEYRTLTVVVAPKQ